MEVGCASVNSDVDNACWDSPSLYNSDTKRHFALAVTCVCVYSIYIKRMLLCYIKLQD
jgi:hypothetical protein